MFQFKNEAGRETVYLYGTIGKDWWDDRRGRDDDRMRCAVQRLHLGACDARTT